MSERALAAPVATKSSTSASGVLMRRCACGNHSPGGGQCHSCAKSDQRLQPKLSVGASNSAAEREADRVADQVTAAPLHAPVTPAISHLQRRTQGDEAGADQVPESVERTLAGMGTPLASPVRRDMERRFGADFSAVRVHVDGGAAQSAREVNAHAYTVGRDIVFANGHYKPETPGGRRLLAHELTHVVQQGQAPGGAATLQREEGAAASEPVVEDDSFSGRATREVIQRVAAQAAGVIRRASPMPIPESILTALLSAIGAFIHRSYVRLVQRGEGMRILRRVTELLNPSTAVEFYLRYLWGLFKGLVSPLTGLVHLAAGAVRLQIAAIQWLSELPTRSPELLEEANAVRQSMEAFGTQAEATFRSLRNRDQLQAFATAVFAAASSATGAFERAMVNEATHKGEQAADSLATHFLETPLPELAETAGEVIGTVVIELVLLLFTEGIGNLITKIGEFARALAPLSRGVRAFAGVARSIGRIVGVIEHAIGALMSRTVLRPLMPLLEALQPLLARFQSFARRLVGMEAAELAAPVAVRLADDAAGAAARTTERGATAAPRAAPRTPAPPPSTPPPSAPPPVRTTPTPPPSRPPVRGATAEGTGADFRYEYHPPATEPTVITRPSGVSRPTAPSATASPRTATPRAETPAPPTAAERAADIDEVMTGATGGTHRPRALDPSPSEFVPPAGTPRHRFTPSSSQERIRSGMHAPSRAGWQRHHIVPLELRRHPAVYEYERLIAGVENPTAALPRDRWINRPENNLTMPRTPTTPGGGGMTAHNSAHPQFTGWMETQLDDLWRRFSGTGMPVETFGREFEDIIGRAEVLLGSGRWGPLLR
jgi:hypothetical protein